MNIKTFIVVAALALVACSDKSAEDQMSNYDLTIQLNDDGSVTNVDATK